MYQHISVQPKPPSTFNPRLSKDIDEVILKALSKQPENRCPSISAFAHALQQATDYTNIPTTPKFPAKYYRQNCSHLTFQANTGNHPLCQQ